MFFLQEVNNIEKEGGLAKFGTPSQFVGFNNIILINLNTRKALKAMCHLPYLSDD